MLRSGVQRGLLIGKRLQSSFAHQARDVLTHQDATLSEIKNGVRVISVSNNKPVTTLGVWIDSGSRYETEGTNGVAKVLEQLLYKGSAKRSSKQLQQDLAKYGARLNSYTNREQTVFLVQVENQNVEPVAEILGDVLRNPKIDAADVEAAKQVVLKQLEEVETNYEEVAWDYLHLTAFQDTPLGLSPYGTSDSIKSIDRQQVIDFADDHYKGDRIVIGAVGALSHGQVESFSQRFFGDISNEYKQRIPPPLGIRFTGSEFQYRDDDIPYLYFNVAVEGVPAGHPDALALQLATQLTGQWDITHGTDINAPSKAVQNISQLHGLKSYEPFSVNYADTGLFGARIVVDGHHQDDATAAVSAIQRQWKHQATGLTDEEVDRAKKQLATVLLGQLQNGTNLANYLATQVLHTSEAVQYGELEERIRKLTASNVREAISRHVYDRDLAVSGVGKTEALPSYIQLRYAQSWWRL